ncbi:hypothetical protein [Paenibacillus sp. XY044]|uniref:hypothetical protein n=1 Tax=Paenibacillus sp. XY044 TaxID=2026089 RepID=UPI000B99D46E|nr:hypothetical protein [Paenibacillus sp. XY044]OZB96540.1 hypothetical protein CJP46_11725 [Paenibacillus sp. XY044]
MPYMVSEQNLRKVENYIVDRVVQSGDRRFQETLTVVAKESGVALMTAIRAIRELENAGKVISLRSASRRIANTYEYVGDLIGFIENQSSEDKIQYLQSKLAEVSSEKAKLEDELDQARKELNRLKRTTIL